MRINTITMVSIPFKRESTFKPCRPRLLESYSSFQFPSNGKAHLNLKEGFDAPNADCISFNSLQTGKHI